MEKRTHKIDWKDRSVLERAVVGASTKSDVLRNLGLNPDTNRDTLVKYATLHNIDLPKSIKEQCSERLEKKCSFCKKVKVLTEFHFSYERSDQRQTKCKVCQGSYLTVWINANPEKWRSYQSNLEASFYAARRRARQFNVYDEDVDPLRVYERDGWVCHICETLVYPYFTGLDSRAPSMDHVIPLSKGGRHSYGNIKLAHVGCNSKKGAKIGT